MIDTAGLSDVGRARAHNEDGILRASLDGGYLLAVADGMGGHRAGEVASRTALAELVGTLRRADLGRRGTDTGDEGTGSDDEQDGNSGTVAALRAGFEAANRAIGRLADAHPEYDGMGTTLVAAVVADGVAVVASVGDSRASFVDEHGVVQVTTDHTLVGELVASGDLAESDARSHPQRNVLTRALGVEDAVVPDVFVDPLDGRVLLLCSDGLTNDVDDETIRDVVTGTASLDAACQALVDLANDRGGSDNVSVVLASERVPGP